MPRNSRFLSPGVTATARVLASLAMLSTAVQVEAAGWPPVQVANDTPCAALAATVLANGEIERAEMVAAGELQPPAGPRLSDLPAFCRIVGTAKPTPRSHIGYEVWLPLTGWSGRTHMVGNGAYSSEIRYTLLATLVRSGAVAVATDTGHQGDDLIFGVSNPDAIVDWGRRSVHESIEAAQRLVKAFYGRASHHTYFSGCSTGGHQALTEAQYFPDDFDGIIAGDPGNNRTNLNLGFLWQFLQNHAPGDNTHTILDRAALARVTRAVVAQCDALDGVTDGVVANPSRCPFKPEQLLCASGQTTDCLTPRQVTALSAMYAGPRRPGTGERLYPGWPVGSEFVSGQGASMGWDLYWSNPAHPEEPQRVDYFRRWIFNDTAWNWWHFDWDKDVDAARTSMADRTDAKRTDLSAFRSHGGKLIMFVGWQDPVVSAYDTVAYYEAVTRQAGGLREARSFANLFLVPGMEHCAGGPGATNFSSTTRDSWPLVSDPEHDVSLALQAWVESGREPRELVAAKYLTAPSASDASVPAGPLSPVPTVSPDAAQRKVSFTRKLCAYPAEGIYLGRGDPNSAANWVCKVPRH